MSALRTQNKIIFTVIQTLRSNKPTVLKYMFNFVSEIFRPSYVPQKYTLYSKNTFNSKKIYKMFCEVFCQIYSYLIKSNRYSTYRDT